MIGSKGLRNQTLGRVQNQVDFAPRPIAYLVGR